jgi:hypothetical protein
MDEKLKLRDGFEYDRDEIQDVLIMRSMEEFVKRVLDMDSDDCKPWFSFCIGLNTLTTYMHIPCTFVKSDCIKTLSQIQDTHMVYPEPGIPILTADISNDTWNLENGDREFIHDKNKDPMMVLTLSFEFHEDDLKEYRRHTNVDSGCTSD